METRRINSSITKFNFQQSARLRCDVILTAVETTRLFRGPHHRPVSDQGKHSTHWLLKRLISSRPLLLWVNRTISQQRNQMETKH